MFMIASTGYRPEGGDRCSPFADVKDQLSALEAVSWTTVGSVIEPLPDAKILGLATRRLEEADARLLATFCARCSQFFELVTGAPGSEKTAAEILDVAPPGVPAERKYALGFTRAGELVGVVDLIDGYPLSRAWFVGLLLLAPEARNRGLGRALWDALERWVRGQGGQSVGLVVQTQNPAARRFWERRGFVVEGEGDQISTAVVNRVWRLRKDLEPNRQLGGGGQA